MTNRKITALPSLVICKDGAEKEFDSLSENERNEIKSKMCRNINVAMGNYYTEHKNDWIDFIKRISA